MSKKINKAKVVTFQLVDRSLDDPLSHEPGASKKVLVPIYVGSDVKDDMVQKLSKQLQPDEPSVSDLPVYTKRGIGASYNKYFGIEHDDGEDYSKYFKAIDDQADDGIFVAPDGSVHDLRKRETNVDLLVEQFGFDREIFGTEVDPNLPKLVDDTDDLLGAGIDPEVLAAMDDDDVDELDDDFFAKALALENEDVEDEDEDEEEKGMKKSVAKSRVSVAPSHASHISHRSEAMDFVEEKVDHLLNTVYNEEEELGEEEEDDDEPVNWDDVINDFHQFRNPLSQLNNKEEMIQKLEPKKNTKVEIQLPDADRNVKFEIQNEDDNVDEEEMVMEENEPKEKWDCESIIETYSTTENRPFKVRDENIPVKNKIKKQNKEIEEEKEPIVEPNFQPRKGETKEEAKARKKAIKEYNKQRRIAKKETKQKFKNATRKVKKSIAASGASRGQSFIPLD